MAVNNLLSKLGIMAKQLRSKPKKLKPSETSYRVFPERKLQEITEQYIDRGDYIKIYRKITEIGKKNNKIYRRTTIRKQIVPRIPMKNEEWLKYFLREFPEEQETFLSMVNPFKVMNNSSNLFDGNKQNEFERYLLIPEELWIKEMLERFFPYDNFSN